MWNKELTNYALTNSGLAIRNSQSEMRQFPLIMLVDMNSFFASVEQQANPFWRGQPLGVCVSLHATSTLIATSKEAKALGIKTGTSIYKAKKICPEIVVVEAEPEKYREVNRRINQIFGDYTDRVESYSIDESFLELRNNPPQPSLTLREGVAAGKPPLNEGGGRGSYKNPLEVGAEIKKRIKAEVGEWLTCSVGISSNKFLAKLAADMPARHASQGEAGGENTSDNMTVIWREHLPEIYRRKKLTELWGLSRGWAKRLVRLGILTPLDLMNYPVANLIAVFGKSGFWLWQRVNGLEIDKLRISDYGLEEESAIRNSQSDNPKSFGNSWVLNFRSRDKEKLKSVILRLAEKAARRMRGEGQVARGLYLSIRLTSGEHLGQSKKLAGPIETGLELYEQVMVIWKSWQLQSEAMHIAVGFTNLSPRVNQLKLKLNCGLTDYGLNTKSAIRNLPGLGQESLQKCLDTINDKYGEFAIRSGLLTRSADYAPDSIAFGR